jgi:hypothetical protein
MSVSHMSVSHMSVSQFMVYSTSREDAAESGDPEDDRIVNQARPFPQSSFRAAALEDPGAAR